MFDNIRRGFKEEDPSRDGRNFRNCTGCTRLATRTAEVQEKESNWAAVQSR